MKWAIDRDEKENTHTLYAASYVVNIHIGTLSCRLTVECYSTVCPDDIYIILKTSKRYLSTHKPREREKFQTQTLHTHTHTIDHSRKTNNQVRLFFSTPFSSNIFVFG